MGGGGGRGAFHDRAWLSSPFFRYSYTYICTPSYTLFSHPTSHSCLSPHLCTSTHGTVKQPPCLFIIVIVIIIMIIIIIALLTVS